MTAAMLFKKENRFSTSIAKFDKNDNELLFTTVFWELCEDSKTFFFF